MTRRPFPLPIPPELAPYILDFHWSVERLHSLDLPSVDLPVADLAHHLDLPFWAYDGPFQVSPHQVQQDPLKYQAQYAHTLAADLRYPLDVVRRQDGRMTVLDGVHRLLRAEMSGFEVVRARVLEWNELDRIAVRG
jgi:hypothetical protein